MNTLFVSRHGALRSWAQSAWLCAMLLGCTLVPAQTVYRIVGADGRVTFSDKPAVSPSAKVTPLESKTTPKASATATLPFALRQVVTKFPVVLYTSNNCTPCDNGRRLLQARGIPFAEKTIVTAQDGEALKNLSGASSLPFLTVGAQHITGFSSGEWASYLNAAGYPAQSQLPPNFQAPAAMPMVTPVTPAPVEVSATPPAAPAAVRPNPAPTNRADNPAGIEF